MQVTTITSATFRQLGPKFRKAANGKQLRAALTKAIRGELEPAVKDVKAAITGLKVTTGRGGGRRQRLAYYNATHKRAGKLGGRHGLRATVARGVRSRVKYSGNTVGARIFEDVSVMPPDQRKLPKYLDRPGGWRHPTYGHDPWVKQVGGPWFDPPIRPHVAKMRAAIVKAVTETMKELQA